MANPKNPVRAARQAGRQQIKAAKDVKRTAIQQAKVAKIQGRTAQKVAKIQKSTPSVKREPVEAGTPLKGKDISPIKPKVSSPTPVKSTPRPVTNTVKKTTPAKKTTTQAPQKKKTSSSGNWIDEEWKKKGYTRGKDGKVRNAQGQTPEEAESQRVNDMFLQPGETRENTLPYTFTEQAKKDAAKKAAMENIQKIYNRFSSPGSSGTRANTQENREMDRSRTIMTTKYKKGGTVKKKYQTGGKVDPYTTKATATAPMYKRSGMTLKKNPDGTYTKAKSGGSIKRKK